MGDTYPITVVRGTELVFKATWWADEVAADVTLGGVVDYCVCVSAGRYGSVSYAGVEYLGVELLLEAS